MDGFVKGIMMGVLAALSYLVSNTGGASLSYLQFGSAGTGGVGMSAVAGLFDQVAIVAQGFAFIYFLYDINIQWALNGHDMTPKGFLSPILKYGAASIMISQSSNLFLGGGFTGLFDTFVAELSETPAVLNLGIGSSETEWGTWYDNVLGGVGLIAALVCVIFALIMWIVGKILTLVWNYKAILFKLEFLYRAGIAPFAMADAYNGLNSNCVRWIKGFVGLVLYGAAFVMLPKIGLDIMKPHLEGILNESNFATLPEVGDKMVKIVGAMAEILVLPFAELGVLGTIKQLCKEVAA